MRRFFIWIGFVVASALATGCGDDPVAPNRSPVIAAQRDTSVAVDDTLWLQARAQDPDGDALTYHLTVFVEIRNEPLPDVNFDGATGRLVFVAADTDEPSRQFSFTAQDGRGGQDSTTFTVNVTPFDKE